MKKQQNTNVLPADFQKKLKSITNPKELFEFMSQFASPIQPKAPTAPASQKPNYDLDEDDIEFDEEDEDERDTTPNRIETGLVPIAKERVSRTPQQPNNRSAWYDIVTNDTEAMVIDLYARGLTTRDIVNFMKRTQNIELNQPAISSITDKVFPLVKEWLYRPLSACYPVVYLDGIHFKVRDAGKITSKVAYIALGVNQYGQKEVMGIWISETEGSKFWMHVLNDLKNRGVDDILIACVDGLKGFPEAIKTIFPRTDVQVCIVHQIRHTLMFISHKDKKKYADFLKTIYTAPSEGAALDALHEVQKQWPKYASYLEGWEKRWSDLSPFFGYPEAIKKMIYTTNTIENLNRQFRKVTKTTQVFPHDEALVKLLWLCQANISDGWRVAQRNWGEIMAQFTILFPDRIRF